MSEEELNQELSTDELKDVAGGIRVGGNANKKRRNLFGSVWTSGGVTSLRNRFRKGGGKTDNLHAQEGQA